MSVAAAVVAVVVLGLLSIGGAFALVWFLPAHEEDEQ